MIKLKATTLLTMALIGSLLGCGGSAELSPGPNVPFSGGIPTTTVVSTERILASSQGQTVILGGEPTWIPPTTEDLPAGTQFCVIPAGVTLVPGATFATSSRNPGAGFLTMRSLPAGQPGPELPVNDYVKMLVRIGTPVGDWEITLGGPMHIGPTDGAHLTTESVILRFSVQQDWYGTFGKVGDLWNSLPYSYSGAYPVNGGSTLYKDGKGPHIEIELDSVMNGLNTVIALDAGSWKLKKQVKVAKKGFQDYLAFYSDNVGGRVVPSTGLKSILFSSMFILSSQNAQAVFCKSDGCEQLEIDLP
jgi:hypothetical protein